jgi:hypothetical protein
MGDKSMRVSELNGGDEDSTDEGKFAPRPAGLEPATHGLEILNGCFSLFYGTLQKVISPRESGT